jgi:hypothetical protein
MSALPLLTDGDYATRLLLAPTKITRPFLNHPTKDSATKLFERWYEIHRDSYTPFAALATLPAESTSDPADTAAYILEEGEPDTDADGTQRVRCLFGHVPPQQTLPTSIKLTKPTLSGTFPLVFGRYRITKPDASLERYDVYRIVACTGDGGAPAFYPSGGTYTLTFGGATTGALNYSDSAATVQAALNALTPVSNKGSVTCGGTYNDPAGISILFGSAAQFTLDIGSLTGGTLTKSESLQAGGFLQQLRAYRPAGGSAPTALNLGGITWSSATPLPATYLDYTDSTRPRINNAYRISFGPQSGSITGGTFTLSLLGATTSAISVAGTMATIKAALQTALNTALGSGVVEVGYWPELEGYYGTAAMDAFTIGASGLPSVLFLLTFPAGGATGGTFTITAGASTTSALAYNATAATIQTALNLLTYISNRGGCTVSGDLAAGLAITIAAQAFTATSSLTPTGSTITPSFTDGTVGRTHKLVFASSTATRDIYGANHGITAGQTLLLRTASNYYYPVVNYTVLDASTIRLQVSAADSYAAAGTITEFGVCTKPGYTPGVGTVPARKVTNYYLPGITAGITTDDDIPIPANQSDTTNFLEAIFAGTGTLNWEVGDLDIYHGPIRSLTKTTINAGDV